MCDALGVRVLPQRTTLGAFVLSHEPAVDAPAFSVCGHVHPATTLRGGGDALRLPAALVDADRMILPAFSSFVAGVRVRPRPTDSVYAFAPDRVFRVTANQHASFLRYD